MEGFWRHSLCVGICAKLLAEERGVDIKMREEYFTAGLLHDIGKIPLNAALQKEYRLALSKAKIDRTTINQAEQLILGLDHCTVGAMIVNAWKLDGAIGDAIIYHHNFLDYSGFHRDVLFSVIAANRFAALENIGFSGNLHPGKVDKKIWKALNVDEDFLLKNEEKIIEEIEKARIFLKI